MEKYRELIEGLTVPTPAALNELDRLQYLKEGWELGEILLNVENDTCRFYGALVLLTKLKGNWKDIRTSEKKDNLKRLLLDKIREFSLSEQVSDMVLIKLLSTTIALIFQYNGDELLSNLLEIIALFDSLSMENPLRIELIKLKYLTILPEDYAKDLIISAQKNKLQIALAQGGRDIALKLIEKYIKVNNQQLEPAYEQLRISSLDCLFSWVEYGVPSLLLPGIVDSIMENFAYENTFTKCINILQETLGHRNANQVQDTLYKKMKHILYSSFLKNNVHEALNNQNESKCQSLLRLYSFFGESYIRKILHEMEKVEVSVESEHLQLFEIILTLMNFPGSCGVDQNITQEAFDFWKLFLDECLDYTNIDEHEDENEDIKEGNHSIKKEILKISFQLDHILLLKVKYPEEDNLLNWSDDEYREFAMFRNECGDLASDLHFILKAPHAYNYFNHSATLINTLIKNEFNTPNAWQELEATFYLLRKIASGSLDLEIIPTIELFFSTECWGLVFNSNSPLAFQNKFIKKQALYLASSYIFYYKHNIQILRNVVEKVISCANHFDTVDAATTSFRDICNTADTELSQDSEMLVSMLANSLNNLKYRDMERIIQSLSSIIASAKDDPMAICLRLEKLTNFILEKIIELLDIYIKTQNPETSEQIARNFGYLHYSCKGIRTASYIVAVDVPLLPIPAAIPYTEKVFLITSKVLELAGNVNSIAMEISSFVMEGLLTLQIPTPFCFPLGPLTQLILSAIEAFPNLSYLNVAAQIVSTYGNNKPSEDHPLNMEHINLITQFSIKILPIMFNTLSKLENEDEYEDITIGISTFIQKLLSSSPHSFYLLPEDIMKLIIKYIGDHMQTQYRPVLQSLAKTMLELFLFEMREKIYTKELNMEFYPKMRTIMQNGYGFFILEKILLCIGGQISRSYLKHLSEPFRKFLTTHKEECKPWFTELMARENFPTNFITLEAKNKFMVEFVKGSINSMKFKTIVEYFFAVCANLAQGDYTESIFH
ncbi:hypothetical protein K502DRAFT_326240 [Neoconidiobolus thromboides FSU 785]|nr:hypothetical protein K502DRAFT_326240 [Neoconidiobolus thromboides FSU 785]